MSKLLAALTTGALAFASSTIAFESVHAENNDAAADAAHENYQVTQKKCNALRADKRDRCLQQAKAAFEGATVGCEGLSDSAKRKCAADAHAQQQKDTSQPAQSATGTTNPSSPR